MEVWNVEYREPQCRLFVSFIVRVAAERARSLYWRIVRWRGMYERMYGDNPGAWLVLQGRIPDLESGVLLGWVRRESIEA